MWVKGGVDGCKDTGGDCFNFIGKPDEYDGSSTTYSNVSGYELSTNHYEQMYETTSLNCNPIVDCGWADFVTKHADDGLVNYCTSTDDWLLDDTDDSATDIIYLYTPEFCKMGYELISYTATGTGCYPLNQGTPLFACSPCAKGTFKFPLTCF